jgi:hydrogenase expression/formation protein HypE
MVDNQMKQEKITISEGGGGRLASKLIEDVFLKSYGNEILNKLDDSAEFLIEGKRLAFTTDSYTIKPIFFPGGDIGRLSVCGTINDLAVKGAKPLVLSVGLIIEEGFPKQDLITITESIQKVTEGTGVSIVTGDTKVVGRGEVDGIFINTSGIGILMEEMNVSGSRAIKGDKILLSGTIADHGMAIMNAREELGFDPPIKSDVAPVFSLIEKIVNYAKSIHVMRDPTRGGVAGILNEIAKVSKVTLRVFEDKIRLNKEVKACCDLLGMDPLYMANEGKVILFVDRKASEKVLELIRSVPLGKEAEIIGEVDDTDYCDNIPPVHIETSLGTKRFLPQLEGDPLPRIC